MKLLLDANLSREIADELVKRGYDVDAVTTRDDIPGNMPDDQVLALAHNEQRVVVTNNIGDFRKFAAQRVARGAGHSGLILIASTIPRNKAANKGLADGIEEKIRQYGDGLQNNETWISNA